MLMKQIVLLAVCAVVISAAYPRSGWYQDSVLHGPHKGFAGLSMAGYNNAYSTMLGDESDSSDYYPIDLENKNFQKDFFTGESMELSRPPSKRSCGHCNKYRNLWSRRICKDECNSG